MTEPKQSGPDAGFQPWHIYLLLGIAGATWAVVVSNHTHPVALILISVASIGAGLVGLAVHKAVMGFSGRGTEAAPATGRTRQFLLNEKALILRSIKELEFDRAMRKVGDADYEEISSHLRARAMSLMQDLEGLSENAPASTPVAETARGACATCGKSNDADAHFCKHCGSKL